jgi:shikimate kinase
MLLVGMMGAGKTSVGEVCARRLGRPFVDTDDLVEATTGASVADVFAVQSEARFRELERAAVADACASPLPAVIACGGGAVLDPGNRHLIGSAGFVVWLRASADVLAARVGGGVARARRPLLAPGALPTLERLAAARAAAYEAVADAAVDTDARTVDEVADAVLEACGR